MVRRGPWAGYLFSQHSLPLLPLDPPFPSIPPPTQPSDCCISDFRGNTNHTCGVRTVLSLLSDTSLPELHSLSCSCAFFFAAPPPRSPPLSSSLPSILSLFPSSLLPLPPPLHLLLSPCVVLRATHLYHSIFIILISVLLSFCCLALQPITLVAYT